MKKDESLSTLKAELNAFQEAEQQRLEAKRMKVRAESTLKEIASASDMRLDDPRTQQRLIEAGNSINIATPRERAAEERIKVLTKRVVDEFEAQRRVRLNKLNGLRDATIARIEAANQPFYSESSHVLKQLIERTAFNSDAVRKVNRAIAGLTRWSGPNVDFTNEVRCFIKTAEEIEAEFNLSQLEAPTPIQPNQGAMRRVRIERMEPRYSQLTERQEPTNVAHPAMIGGNRFEPGKEYDVDEATYRTLKAMKIVRDVTLLEKAADTVKTAVGGKK